ncbi:hypothetical protein BK659_16335 [Pseudomonas brassicacearum]|uniref:Delta-60 repeat domain-containing protein n=1 Tax=Pseudomonas brassicacearum TaxID=930166 RepID=A0A423H4L0_9PSED|nr:hypothetical protein [Pseudomonas brassicacearum]RON08128.1 hypothetical protein BK659_16335 [Pseudomonas brassicacearum]
MNQMAGTKAAGTLDPSFGNGGVVAAPGGTKSIAVLPNNKLIVLTGASLREPLTVARLTEAGELDPSFGNGGVVEIPITGYSMLASHIIALENGNYLISGYESGTAPTRKYVCRLLENGQLDASFGEAGMATIQITDIAGVDIGEGARFINSGEEEVAGNAVFFSSDRIVVSEQNAKIYLSAHIYTEKRGFEGIVFRLNENGSRDTSFNGGYVLIPTPDLASNIYLISLTLQRDGVLVAGAFATAGPRGNAFLSRYDQSGNLDVSFGERGMVIIPNGTDGRTSKITSVVVSGNGLIVASGESGKGGEKEGLIAVLNPNGGFNLIFNKGQPLYAAFLPDLVFSTIVLQQDRKIIVTGSGDGGYLVAARYELDGSLDLTFGGEGWVVFHHSGTLAAVSSELTPDNKVVVLGTRTFERYAVRYLG